MALKVETQHGSVATMSSVWRRCRDAYAGSDAVKAGRELYLPRLDAMTDPEYNAYLLRALYYNATGRTVEGLSGAVFRKPPSLKLPEELREHLEDVTLSGVSFDGFAAKIVEEDLKVGRAGILVDRPDTTVAARNRPYWLKYDAEQVINWRTAIVDGDRVLSLIVLKECEETPDAIDPFVTNTVDQYRVLQLVDRAKVGQNGKSILEVVIWRKPKDGQWTPGVPIYPQRRGEHLSFIPFTFIGPTDITPDIAKPPTQDLVDVNLSHFRSSADYEHGAHYTALPTPVASGVKGDAVLKIGSSQAWLLEDPQARAEFLEFKGEGLGALEKAMDRKEMLMAILGARLLEGQTSKQETASTVRMRHAGDESVLKKLALACSQGLTQALRWHVWWEGKDVQPSDVAVALNTDVLQVNVSADQLAKLLLTYQSGRISKETLYYNLVRGEFARPGVSYEEEEDAIAADENIEPEPEPEPPPANE
jgi:hypothetical protein